LDDELYIFSGSLFENVFKKKSKKKEFFLLYFRNSTDITHVMQVA